MSPRGSGAGSPSQPTSLEQTPSTGFPPSSHPDAPSSSHLLLCSTKPWSSCHSPSPAARRGQSCGFAVTTESTMRPGFIVRPVLLQGALPTPGKHGTSTWHLQLSPSPVSPGNRVSPSTWGWRLLSDSRQPGTSNKFSYSNNPAPAAQPGLFPAFQGVTPGPHFSSPTVPLSPAGIKAEHQIPTPHIPRQLQPSLPAWLTGLG